MKNNKSKWQTKKQNRYTYYTIFDPLVHNKVEREVLENLGYVIVRMPSDMELSHHDFDET